MDVLDMIYDKMYCELEDIAKKEKLDSKDVELIDKFVDIIKDIDEISMSQNGMDGYSQMNGMQGRSGRMMPYNRGSYARGRSMSNGYSRTDNKDAMIDHLHDVMDMAVDEKDRKAISRLIEQMDQRM